MKKCILGKKLGMTQLFNEDGIVLPTTVIEAGPCTVIQKKTKDSDGYNAIKVGFIDVVEKKLNKPDRGQYNKIKVSTKKIMKEFRLDDISKFEVGQKIMVSDMFAAGDKVDVSGVSKGKGFQGTIKRYGHSGGDDTHGSMYHRRVGSMGANTSPARVFKGKKLPGHMGADKVTIQNLSVIKIDNERNLILIRGAVPGPRGGLIIIKDSVKV